MKRLPTLFFVMFAALIVAGVAAFLVQPPDGTSADADLIAVENNTEGFARADGPKEWDFPADYGPHPDFQTEWWYYTGNLQTEEGRHFGYQFTLFRRAVAPPQDRADRSSEWGADQVFMAHFAVTDVAD
ncbi:MAG: carotenoid 1,2-hydratase, partial [Chloroflexi bacterium]|nr:carotenoid 1,2-hydratase [Chloroflexota bacterium]